jgi:hypothetical protein
MHEPQLEPLLKPVNQSRVASGSDLPVSLDEEEEEESGGSSDCGDHWEGPLKECGLTKVPL